MFQDYYQKMQYVDVIRYGCDKRVLSQYLIPVLRIRIRDPVPFLPMDPGWVKSKNPDPG